jgi:hypothetical protein
MVQINLFVALLLTATLGLLTAAILKPQETYKYFQRKRYQYNITLALYMLTPTERFIFSSSSTLWPSLLSLLCDLSSFLLLLLPIPPFMLTLTQIDSILFLTLMLLSFAACLYLPEHLAIITRRVYYYCVGDGDLSGSLHALTGSIMGSTGAVLKSNASAVVESVGTVGRKTSGDMAREMLGRG